MREHRLGDRLDVVRDEVLARVEKLDYPAGTFSVFLKRFTAGARVRVTPWLVAQTNFVPLLIHCCPRTTVVVPKHREPPLPPESVLHVWLAYSPL